MTELDAQIAMQVMGWTLVEYPGGDDHWRDTEGRQWPIVHWKPSTDLLDAWKVVEHMERQVPDEFMLWAENGNWGAEFADGQSRFAQTAPLTICLAALVPRRAASPEVTVP